jgi:hypothetical protein
VVRPEQCLPHDATNVTSVAVQDDRGRRGRTIGSEPIQRCARKLERPVASWGMSRSNT